MSRIHEALRKAAQENPSPFKPAAGAPKAHHVQQGILNPPPQDAVGAEDGVGAGDHVPVEPPQEAFNGTALIDAVADLERLEELVQNAPNVAFDPLPESLLINPAKPRATPAEEFRSLRTRLNHLQTQQPMRTLVITSPSPAEGKSFTAMNLAVTQAQLAGKRVLLADFDLRRPIIDKTFRIAGRPGITDYLQGKVRLGDIINRVEESNLYLMTAGSPVSNPLELLNLRECQALLESLRSHFDWVVLDSPPLLFAADANLLSTMADGTILVVRIGSTTFDSVTRAMQSLCENNLLGVVVNGARRGELYSKYSYYHDYYYAESQPGIPQAPVPEEVSVPVNG